MTDYRPLDCKAITVKDSSGKVFVSLNEPGKTPYTVEFPKKLVPFLNALRGVVANLEAVPEKIKASSCFTIDDNNVVTIGFKDFD